MTSATVLMTIEELFFEYDGKNYDACVDAAFEFELEPGEKATRDYPGCGPTVECVGFKIEKVEVWDDSGTLVDPPADMIPGRIFPKITEWWGKNEEMMEEMACDEAAQADEAARELAAENRYNILRGV